MTAIETDTGATTATAVDPYGPPADEMKWLDIARELAPSFAATAAELDERAELPLDNLRAIQESGLDTAPLGKEFGGGGMSYRTFGPVLAEITKACPATGCIWLMHAGAATTLTSLSPQPVAEFYANEWLGGKRFANALSEPTSGNLFLVPLQSAEPTDGGWVLDGAKRFVSGCEIADHLLVNALVDGAPSFFGTEADETVTPIPIWDTMGMRATRSQLLSFEGSLLRTERRCRAPEPGDQNLIGLGLPWLSLGIARAAYDALVSHAQQRVIPSIDAPLSHMQWVQFDVAEAAVSIRSAEGLAARTMWLADQRSPEAMSAAIDAKLLANQVAKSVAELGVRIGGASGYLRTSSIQRHFRDAQAGGLMAYSVELCRDWIGKSELGVE
ncbi:acyl-CoA dehydrogenase family protein [Ilumatobacter coccineus]|uniref:Putative acyl-CoA dehydrogenase n=1 Tax=Ilumatobacter coccineus (strain NBRC 103263 / KCTC 29153 / YM16-304) TaxID=1313172 RepID=A0A6C7E8K7_ILUCY|nr:acyl-CoA dehydrogenase family protein [Ilumatobacter coccineus]BAN00366.1 putative acyl-CoA dehydrogenase [Ilumatobacter coccineus YM16-304]